MKKAPASSTGPALDLELSYLARICSDCRMKPEKGWRTRARALEYWVMSALVAGSFAAGLWGALRWLLG